MRRINILYLSIPVLIYGLFLIYRQLNRSTAVFYGVAENQETQINLEHAVTVNRIYATQGQFVQKGALLMEVTRTALDFKMSDLSHNIAELEARDQLRVADIRAGLDRLRAQRAEKTGAIEARIRQMESEQLLNKSLLRELRSVPPPDSSAPEAASPFAAKLGALHEELRLAVEPLDVEIGRLEQALHLSGLPAQSQISKLKKDVELYQKEQEQLRIYAPGDGLVGSIHCREGENIPAFNTLISFYEQNPNTVVGYLHESLIVQVKIGDSLRVISSLHPEEQCLGRVSGLGHRVVEIPERLRKLPEIKTYGREILIQIPANNNFLQKEKVVLQRFDAPGASVLPLLAVPFPRGS